MFLKNGEWPPVKVQENVMGKPSHCALYNTNDCFVFLTFVTISVLLPLDSQLFCVYIYCPILPVLSPLDPHLFVLSHSTCPFTPLLFVFYAYCPILPVLSPLDPLLFVFYAYCHILHVLSPLESTFLCFTLSHSTCWFSFTVPFYLFIQFHTVPFYLLIQLQTVLFYLLIQLHTVPFYLLIQLHTHSVPGLQCLTFLCVSCTETA